MRLVVDESVDRRIVDRFRLAGHDVIAIAESAAGTADELVLHNADTAGVLLLTADKDFGELVYRRQMAHCGVVLLRQAGLSIDLRAGAVVAVLKRMLRNSPLPSLSSPRIQCAFAGLLTPSRSQRPPLATCWRMQA